MEGLNIKQSMITDTCFSSELNIYRFRHPYAYTPYSLCVLMYSVHNNFILMRLYTFIYDLLLYVHLSHLQIGRTVRRLCSCSV